MPEPTSTSLNLLVLGRGKTGSLVAQIARERGHADTVLGSDAPELTPTYLESFDAVIDFTTPEAVIANLEACLTAGARIVVGTTGWYAQLPRLTALAQQHNASLLYGTNFSLGVQAFFRAAQQLAHALPGASFRIHETHHVTKKDAPSGTALTLQQYVAGAAARELAEVPIISTREGDAAGLHVLEISTAADKLTLTHEARSRRGFAEGAVRAAEWLQAQPERGAWNFADIAATLH